jgi:hypothetical protein
MRALLFLLAAIWATPALSAAANLEAEGKALLQKFLDPKADRAALTWALKPTEADVKSVYSEPLGSKLAAFYSQMFKPGTAIGPKEGQTELLYVFATTGQLKAGAPVAGEFPGGYAKVTQYMAKDVPIVRFKFVKPGETAGMAFDGLIHVNGRWVFMPKPWNAAE